jgi:Glutamine amidotransferases class-II
VARKTCSRCNCSRYNRRVLGLFQRHTTLHNQTLFDSMIARSRLLTSSQRRWILSASSRSNHSAARFGRPVKATAVRSLNQWSNQAWLTGRATTISSSSSISSFYYRYSTERIVAKRSGRSATATTTAAIPTLYDASRETENCGVGLIASLKSVPSRDIVEKADEMLVRMAHRGGCGCDPASGDGSGMCPCAPCVCVCVNSLCSQCVKRWRVVHHPHAPDITPTIP